MTTVKVGVVRSHGHALGDVHYWAGAVSGILASLGMGIVVMLATLIQGRGLFFVPEKIATLVLSDQAAVETGGIITGLGIHMLLGAIFGIIFAVGYTLVTTRYELASAVGLGLLYGFGLWVANFLVIGPAIGAQLTSSVEAGLAIPAHLVFGLILGLYPLFIRGDEAES